MPQHIVAPTKIGSAFVDIRTSDVIELLGAVIAIARSDDVTVPWIEEARSALGQERFSKVVDVCRQFRRGVDLLEFVASSSIDSVEELLAFIAALDGRALAYYLLGRMYEMEEIPVPLSTAGVERLLSDTDTADSAFHEGADFSWADEPETARDQIVAVLRSVWEGYVRDSLVQSRDMRERQRADLAAYAERYGGLRLWQSITDHDQLPMEVPAGHEYERLYVVPSCTTSYSSSFVFGHGTIILTVDCRRSIHEVERRRENVERMLQTIKALGDRNRLRILRLIHKHCHEMNGKQIAECVELSPSVVSRHLGQLKQAGLVSEHSPDNRNITYTVNSNRLEAISAELLTYLNQSSDVEEARASSRE